MDLNHIRQLNVPHLDEYFGLWAIDGKVFGDLVQLANRIDLAGHVDAATPEPILEAAAGDGEGSPFGGQVVGGIAIIDIAGPMMKFRSSMAAGTGTVRVRREIRAAIADDRVKALMLRIDSPGGTVSGTDDLAEDVAAAAARKTTWAFIEDIGASAAYWVASQAARVSAGKSALVGSIGTFAVIHDYSGLAAKEGIKVHVMRAGAFKGAGTPGTEVTAEQLAEWQRTVDGLNSFFKAAVRKGRRMSEARMDELADGRVHNAAEAQALGLIDAVESFDAAMTALSKAISARGASPRAATQSAENQGPTGPAAQETNMTEQNKDIGTTDAGAQSKGPSPATIAELKAAFPKSTAEFRESCLEKGLTLAQATSAWAGELQAQLDAAQADLVKARESGTGDRGAGSGKPQNKAANAAGVEPLGAGNLRVVAESSDDAGNFQAALDAALEKGEDRYSAVERIARAHPGWHKAFLLACNPKRKAQSLIEDKFEAE